MKTIKIKRPKYFWADYTSKRGEYNLIELRIYRETSSVYQGKKYYHSYHLCSINFQGNQGKTLGAYGMRFEFENDYHAIEALRLIGQFVRANTETLKGTLRLLKKNKLQKYIYSDAIHDSGAHFIPYNMRNDAKLYRRLLG